MKGVNGKNHEIITFMRVHSMETPERKFGTTASFRLAAPVQNKRGCVQSKYVHSLANTSIIYFVEKSWSII